ncbi:MAG: hypothetical protein MUC77_20430 [Chromatiaceae bacterium]|nr:hypothetical protein [Chromatiaceae bacterium]
MKSGLVTLPDAVAQAKALENISVGYALTYVFGTLGMILAARFFPRILRIDLPAEAAKLARERGLGGGPRRGPGASLPVVRAYRLPADMVGKTVAEVDAETGHLPGKVLKIRRRTELLEGAADLVLEAGDVVSIIADIGVHEEAREKTTEEVLDADLLNYQVTTREIVVTDAKVVGKTLKELDLPNIYGCFVTALTRASIDLPVDPALPLQKGDRLEVVGERDNLQRLAEAVGFAERDLEKTDLATFAFGMITGTLLGLVTLRLGEVSIGLGTAGGLLVVGIAIGYLGSVLPTFGRVPAAARYVLMELGLMLFMAGVGLNAGGSVVSALASVGPLLVLGGGLVTLLPPVTAYLVGRWLLRMNPALLLGAITGAMTSTPAMNVVTEAARSGVPALGYAGTYTFANVLLTFAGALMMRV